MQLKPNVAASNPAGTEDRIGPVVDVKSPPGAKTATCVEMSVYDATTSVLLDAAIAMAEEIQAGWPICVRELPFPAEMIVAIPAARRLSMEVFMAALLLAVSQLGGEKCPPPPLKLTAATLTPPGRLFRMEKT